MVEQHIVRELCDLCYAVEENKESEVDFSQTLVIGAYSRKLVWCKEHEEQLHLMEALQVFLDYGISTDDLIRAARSGSKAKMHSCPYCGRQFSREHDWAAHITTHEDPANTPFLCEEPGCIRGKNGQGFRSATALGTHRWKTHGIYGKQRKKD